MAPTLAPAAGSEPIAGAEVQGRTALHHAAAAGQAAVVAQLLKTDLGAAMAADTDGDTPLHLAARFGHAEVVQLLLAAAPGAAKAATAAGATPLHLALAAPVW